MKFNIRKNRISYIIFSVLGLIFIGYLISSQNITKQLKYFAFESKNYQVNYEKELQNERDNDRNYYNEICYACLNDKEKIKQNISEGGDEKWWKYMCTDFCKEYIKNYH